MLTTSVDTKTKTLFRTVMPVLIVDDLVKTAHYYRETLGFHIDFIWESPSGFASLSRDDISINLKQSNPTGKGRSNKRGNGVDIYFCVNDLDQLLEELRAKNAHIVMEPTNQIYGVRELNVEDCDGYILCFGEELIM